MNAPRRDRSSPTPTCPTCHDTGVVDVYIIPGYDGMVRVPMNKKAQFKAEYPAAQWERVVDCDCARQREARESERIRLEMLVQRAGPMQIPADCANATLEAFDALSYDEKVGKKAMRNYTELMAGFRPMVGGDKRVRPGLLFSGPTGGGKSCSAAIIAKSWQAAGYVVAWRNYTRLYEDIKKTYNSKDPNETDNMLWMLGSVPLLVIDEMGYMNYADPVSEDQYKKTHLFIQMRYEKKLPTVITTNQSRDEFYRCFGNMIYDRIATLCHWIEVGVENGKPIGLNLRFTMQGE